MFRRFCRLPCRLSGLAACAFAAALVLSAGITRADWSDDFQLTATNGPGVSPQQTWILFDDAGNTLTAAPRANGGIASTFTYDTSDGALLFGATNTDVEFLGGYVNESFTDVHASALLNRWTNPLYATSNMGLMVRSDPIQGNGYYLLIDRSGGTLNLFKITNSVSSSLDSVLIPDYDAANAYLLDLYAQGSNDVTLSGHIYNASGDHLLATVGYEDSTGHNAGVTGILATQFSNGPILGLWDNILSSSSVPEPASLTLIGMSGLLLIRRRRF